VKCFRKDCGSPETSRAIPALCAIWILSCIQFQIFSLFLPFVLSPQQCLVL
jgi:hypothetical protein